MGTQANNPETWVQSLHERIAEAIRDARRGRMSAQQLADETKRLGYPMTRSQIANYENGRKLSLDVAELMVLAAALRVPPVSLLFGGPPDEHWEVLPGQKDATVAALAWFTGDPELAWPGPDVHPEEVHETVDAAIADPQSAAAILLDAIRRRAGWHGEMVHARNALSVLDAEKDAEMYAGALRAIGRLSEQIDVANALIEAAIAEQKGESE